MIDRLRSIRPPGIRIQLMLWSTTIFALLLFAFSVIFYLTLEGALNADIDADLQLRIRQIAVGITNDNGTTSIAEILEDVPKLDPDVLGNNSTSGVLQGSQVQTGANANFRSFVRILDVKGKTIYASPVPYTIPTPSASVTEALHGTVWKGTITTRDRKDMRLYSARLMYKGALFGVIQVGESLTPMYAILHNILVELFLITPVILLCGAIGSYCLARRAFAPIRTLTSIAQDISAGDLDRRVTVPRPRDEVHYLALTFNQMIARTDEGQVPLDYESVRLDQLVSDVVATLQALAVERSITLQLRKVQPATVQGDPSRLAQCIINLVDNALTYTPIGGVVTIRVEVKGRSGCITIQDTGIGIAPQHLPHIFERFYRADPARSQREGKSGLGLSLVEWIVHAHGGSIEVESQEGCGSTFSVTLPLVKCS